MSLEPPAASLTATTSPVAPPSSSKPPRTARGRPTDDPDTRWSKTLSYILRHGAAKEGLKLREDGFVRVEELMKRPKLKGCDMATLERIVKDDAKQRFSMRPEPTGENGQDELWIRANQGHSIKVEDLELKKVEKAEDVPLMVHGTYYRLWPAIEKEGLKVMTRNHIHCAVGLAGETGVISGMRANCDLFIYLDVPKLLADGIPIFTSTNNVVLTAGADGVVAPQYFAKVVRKNGEVLVPGPARETTTRGSMCRRRLRWRDDIPSKAFVAPLTAVSFVTGLLDATTYASFGTFASAQTGNVIILIISIIHALKEARPINTTASLVAYVVCGGLGGQIANLVGTRVILLAVPTGLVFRHVLDPEVQNDQWIILLLLAASSGFQIAIARTCGVGEIPTAMLSTPIADLITDPALFKPQLYGQPVTGRNRRIAYIFSIVSGTVVGAWMHRRTGFEWTLLLGTILRTVMLAWVAVLPAETQKEASERMTIERSASRGRWKNGLHREMLGIEEEPQVYSSDAHTRV
ncbi:DUF1275 domain protein [Rhodotorula toruloides]|uniref:2'-phosphotransferase n=1 Tax=Rhodotorula toruloides TaxID=5286 RepID=A0A511KB16_RHOTO|nr:DUF1275 domain protein [Rhodotorula toruloides]